MTEAQERGITKRLVNALGIADEKDAWRCLMQALRELDDVAGEDFGRRVFVGLFGTVHEAYRQAAFEALGEADGRPYSIATNLGRMMAAYGRGYARSMERAEEERRAR